MTETTSSHYTPGVCNLNLPEIAYRRKVSNISFAIAAVLLIGLVVSGAPSLLGLLMFLPAWIGYLNHLQAKNKFCVMYAANGVYNSSDKYADTAKVTDESQKQKDAAKARSMNTQGFIAGILATVITVILLSVIE